MAKLLTVLSDWLLYLAGVLASLFTSVVAVVKRNRDRSVKNERRLTGDDANGYEGIMAITTDTRERVSRLEEKMDANRRERKQEHENVMDRLDDISDE